MAHHVVGRAEDIGPGARKRIVVDGRAIVVFNVKGEYFALSDTCPHKGASLCDGKLTGLVTSPEPGRYDYKRQGEIIRCPWHQWEFDLRTGRSYCDPKRMRLMNFPVSIEAGSDVVEGPLKAETFPVAVDAEYVVVEVE